MQSYSLTRELTEVLHVKSLASFSLSFVNESHKNCHNVERIKELDGMVQAYLSNHVANRASIRQVSYTLSITNLLYIIDQQ